MDERAASRYARALFAAALKQDIVASVGDDLATIAALLNGSAKFSHLLENPEIPRSEKLGLLERLFSDRVTALTMQAVRLMLQKGRQDSFVEVQRHYAELRRRHENVLKVEITSAELLSAEHEKALIAKLKSATGKDIESTTSVDPKLMGGVRIRYGDFVLDGSVRNSLARMREKLLFDVLKQASAAGTD